MRSFFLLVAHSIISFNSSDNIGYFHLKPILGEAIDHSMRSVHHPSLAEIARNIPSIFPVVPPLHHGSGWLPEGVLDNTEVVGATLCLTVVEGEADKVGLWSEYKSSIDLFLSNWMFEVPLVNLVGSRVNSGNSSIRIWSDSGLLISVGAISKLENLANEDTFRIRRIGA